MATPTTVDPVVTQRHPPVTSSGAGLIASAIVMPIIATLWTILRIWTRKIRGVSSLCAEDILCYLALVSFWGLGINYLCMVLIGGAGYHRPQLMDSHILRFSQSVFAAQVLYALTLGFTKMSITWMIKRIFFECTYNWIPYGVMVLNFCWMMQTILTGLLLCRPITLNWDPTARGRCGNQTNAFAAVSIVDIITDIFIIALPVKMLWGLQWKQSYKLAVACMFGAGLITIAFTVVRLHSVYTLDFTDVTYTFVALSIIGVVQCGVAIMVASAPLLRPAFDRTFSSWPYTFSRDSRASNLRPSRDRSSRRKASAQTTGASSLSIAKNSKAPGGFQQISESEENLRWEMDVMHADKGKTLTEVSNARHGEGSDLDEDLPSGQIKVTQFTQVSRA